MTTIKFNAGDVVFWLSHIGFSKGWVKSIIFTEEKIDGLKKTSSLKYYLTDDIASVYRGDEVKEELVFTSYQDMISFYQNKNSEQSINKI